MSNEDLEFIAGDREENEKHDRRQRAERALAQLNAAHLSIVPHSPSQYMSAIGAQAGGVDIFTARRVYRAMLAASQERHTVH